MDRGITIQKTGMGKVLNASTLMETIISFIIIGFIFMSAAWIFFQVNKKPGAEQRTKLHLKLAELVQQAENNKDFTSSQTTYLRYIIKGKKSPIGNNTTLLEFTAETADKITIDRISLYVSESTP